MQSNGGAKDRNDLDFRLEAANSKKRNLIRTLAAVNRQIAGIDAEAERGDVQFAEFNPSTGDSLGGSDYPAAYFLLKGIGRNVPGERYEPNYTEDKKAKEQSPQDAAPLWRKRFTQRLRSPELDSEFMIWLVERKLASHPESSSFNFFSDSKSLIFPETSARGAAPLPARVISGNN
jgi:hypothetical protein